MDSRVSSPPLLPQAVYSHSKVTLTCRPAKPVFVAGQQLEGILELACSSDKVRLGGIALEIRGAEQLHSRDHAASQAFMQSDVTFQSARLPPSNAVIASTTSHSGFWPARKGVTRFPFSFAIPPGCPSSCKFAGNASVTYTLLASCQIQLEGEQSILTRRLDVNVVEQWQDWRHERYHEGSEAQVREKIQTGISIGGLGKTEGTVSAQALIQDRLFYRGWELPDGSLEIDRARGEICTHLSIKNATSRTISGLKVSLLRRLKILPSSEMSKDQTLVISAASAPRITETVEEINLHGRGWEFPPSGDETVVDCIIPLPIPEKFLSVRKTMLFEIHTLVKISLDMGTLNKPISFELPIWVAHWASLPAAALQPRSVTRPPIMRPVSSQGLVRARSAAPYRDAGPPQDTFGRRTPVNRSPFTMPHPSPQQHQYIPAPPLYASFPTKSSPSPIDVSYQDQLHSQTTQDFFSFDPRAASMTPSRFMHQETPWSQPNQNQELWDPIQSPLLPEYAPISLAASAPASSYFQMLAQQRMTPSPKLPESLNAPHIGMSRSYSADPTLQHAMSNSPYTPRALPPRMQECLTDEEQARVLANSAPAVYDVTHRAYILRQQEAQSNNSQRGSPAGNSLTGRQRRQSMPTPPRAVQGRFSPIDATPSRPIKTPPLAPSSRFTFQLPFEPASETPEQSVNIAGLETIGEDGESQAGTVRIGKGALAKSASHEQIRSLKAVRAANSAIDEEGNTSVSFLEGLAEQQDRDRQAANKLEEELENSNQSNNILAGLHSSNIDKTLPKAPQTSDKTRSPDEASQGRRRIFDVFPEITSKSDASPKRAVNTKAAQPSPLKLTSQTRAVSNPIASGPGKEDKKAQGTRPLLKASKSDSLLALESRLSRPNSPMSPTFGNDRLQSLSPPPRSDAVSPVQRAVSPVHIGNQGALRKKSSQLSIKRQTQSLQAPSKDVPAPVAKTQNTSQQSIATAVVPSKATSPRREAKPPSEKELAQAGASTEAKVLKPTAVAVATRPHRPTSVDKEPSKRSAKVNSMQRVYEPKPLTTPKPIETPAPSSSSRKPPTLATPRSSVGWKGQLSASSPASSKRHTSDPQKQSGSEDRLKPAPVAPRRQSLDIPIDPMYKFGSARGGRGGVVTSVASLWADIISQEAKNAKNEAMLASTAPQKPSNSTSKATPLDWPQEKAEQHLRAAVHNAQKIQSASAKAENITTKPELLPSRSPAAVKTPRPTPQAPKAKLAFASVNATVGKAPTFAKALEKRSAAVTKASEEPAAVGQGSSNLRALIAKFS